jgi:diamine N-acetyltransferase
MLLKEKTNMPILENKSILLRAPEPEDLDIIYMWENNPDIWHLSNILTPFSKQTLRKFIESSTSDIYELKQTRFIIELKEEKRPVGAIDLFDFDPFHMRAGIGILIASHTDRNNGYAGEALQTLINYCFTILKLKQVYCNITENNQDSLRLFIRHGFVITGQKRDWIRSNDQWLTEFFLQLVRI